MNALVDRLTEALLPHIDRPYALYGHSMGAGIAFELARRLAETHDLQPERLLVSGRLAPHRPSRKLPIYNLANDEFHARLREPDGTPPEVLDHPELMEILLPMLRADFELDDTYRILPGPTLTCPISVYGGLDDPEVDSQDLDAWGELTTAQTTVTYLPGTHFFINEQRDQLLKMIGAALNRR